MYAEICFPFSLDKMFTYRVPSAMVPNIKAGTLVKVLFKNKAYNGFVVSLSNTTKFKGRINSIISINSKTYIADELWQTIIWSANYYITPIGKVTQVALSWIFKKNIRNKRTIKSIGLNTKLYSIDYFSNHFDILNTNQRHIIKYLLTKHPNFIPLIKFKNKIPSIYSTYKTLIKNNFLIEKNIAEEHTFEKLSTQSVNKIKLTNIQHNIYSNIQAQPHSKPQFIYGVTGSGKTEIYLKLTNDIFQQKKSCLILVQRLFYPLKFFKDLNSILGIMYFYGTVRLLRIINVMYGQKLILINLILLLEHVALFLYLLII